MSRMTVGVCLGLFLGLVISHATRPLPAQGEGAQTAKNTVFELRTYVSPPGKLADLHARFRNHTVKLFEKHGMKNIVYLSPSDPKQAENTLVYLIAHSSKEAADKSWADFRNDPEWKAAREESEKNGKLVENVKAEFFTATDYSPLK